MTRIGLIFGTLLVGKAGAGGGEIALTSEVGPGVRYDIEGSGDMREWEPVLQDRTSPVSLSNIRSVYPGYRFFRLRVLEPGEGGGGPRLRFDRDAAGEVVELLAGFDQSVSQPYTGPFSFYAWTAEQRELARQYTNREVIVDEITGSKVLAVKTDERIPAVPFNLLELYPLTDYVPPEADTIRMRIRMLSGEVTLGFGAIMMALGNSYAYTDFQTVQGEDGDWETVEFSLYDDLSRTFRSAWGHTNDAPMIYFARYIQESIFLYTTTDKTAEFRVDDIEFVNKGRGASYPLFSPEETTVTGVLDDFEGAWSGENAFTLSMQPVDLDGGAECEPVDFRQTSFFSTPFAYIKDQIVPWFPPVEIDPLPLAPSEEADGLGAMKVVMHGFETVIWPGIRAEAPPEGTNGLELSMKVENGAYQPGDVLVVDFAIVAASADTLPFPWEVAARPAEWNGAGAFFDFYPFARTGEELSFAMYHARRAVPNGEWMDLHIPFADFTCGYGQGEEPEAWRAERRPLDPSTIVSVNFLSPWRQLRGLTHFTVDHIRYARFDVPQDSLLSFWQIPRATNITLEPYYEIVPEQNFNTRWVKQVFSN